jgi:hypothetical protein
LWQNATYKYSTGYITSSNGSSRDAIFDGLEAEYGKENGNFIFSNGSAGTVHSIEWSTAHVVTVGSFNLMAYHDFDECNINHRGFGGFRLYYLDGTEWTLFYNLNNTDPDGDLHYGGGPSHTSTEHDMYRSYLEFFVELSTPVSAQDFKAEFVQYADGGGPRVVELDGYAVPEPVTLMLLVPCFVGLGIMRKKMNL